MSLFHSLSKKIHWQPQLLFSPGVLINFFAADQPKPPREREKEKVFSPLCPMFILTDYGIIISAFFFLSGLKKEGKKGKKNLVLFAPSPYEFFTQSLFESWCQSCPIWTNAVCLSVRPSKKTFVRSLWKPQVEKHFSSFVVFRTKILFLFRPTQFFLPYKSFSVRPSTKKG